MMSRIFLYVAMGLAVMAFSFTPDVTTDYYVGYAYEQGTKDLIYTEEFADKFINTKHVETVTKYFNPNHKQIAERTLNFRKSRHAPDFRTEDLRTGYVEGAEVTGNKVRLFVRQNINAIQKEKLIKVPEPVVIDGGFNQFIKTNWEKLEKGEKVRFHFTVSARLDYYTLRATKIRASGNHLEVKVEPDEALLRWIVSPITIVYDTKTRRITSYEGKSNIADEDGSNLIARLVYPKRGP